MKWLIVLAAVSALVSARPETYREQEDFQYSRSSSDDGTKSGYYGAQRGNMGGNYERAHNMDGLAQNQMSGLVRQVEGDLGDGAKTRAGSVYSAANSRGIYGSAHFDTSNLQGRNFQEGSVYDGSHLGSALTHSSSAHNSAGYTNSHAQSSSAHNSAGYTNSHGRSSSTHNGAGYHSYGGYRGTTSDAQTQTDDLQSLENLQTINQHNYGSTRHNAGYQSQAGYQEQSQYDGDSTNSNSGYGTKIYARLTPVRIVVTPGRRVAVPVGVQTYDATHGSSVLSHNAIDSETELTNANNHGSSYRPSNNKYYESSYSYNKKWEKHDTVPTTLSVGTNTESPTPKNSELYEDVDVHTSDNQNNAGRRDVQSTHSSSSSGRYNAMQSSSSQSRYQSNYDAQQYRGGSSNSNLNAHTQSGYNSQLNHGASSDSLSTYAQAQRNSGSRYHGVSGNYDSNSQTRQNAGSHLDVNGQVEDLSTGPKSYQSSYSYHKSWERQGDPYVIKPASTDYSGSQTSQRLTSSTKNLGYAGYQSRSHYNQDQSNCDDNCHIRVARSYGTDNQNMEQQSQNLYVEQALSTADLGQQSQMNWDQQNVGQQSQNHWENLEDLSQQSQSNWAQQNVEQQTQNQGNHLENMGQQTQSSWDQLENFGQQSQSNFDQQNVGQQSNNNWDKLENLSQQSQTNFDQQNVGQESNNNWDKLENLGQQSQTSWDQQNVGQQTNNNWDRLENLDQQSQTNFDQQNVGQQTNNNWDKLENLGQQSQTNFDQQNVGQQSHSNWENLESLGQQSQTNWGQQNVGQQANNNWDKIEKIDTQSQSNSNQQIVGQNPHKRQENSEVNQQSLTNWGKLEDVGQQTLNQNTWDKLEDIRQESQKDVNLEVLGQQAQNFLGQHNQDMEYELGYKPQDDIYAQFAHKSEKVQPNVNPQHFTSVTEREHSRNVEIPWDRFDTIGSNIFNETRIQKNQNTQDSQKKLQTILSQDMDQVIMKPYADADVIPQQDLESYKENFNENNPVSNQKESYDNSEYSYSSGFVNPFYNQYRKNQLSSYDSTHSEHIGAFESNTWNSHIFSNSNSHVNLTSVNNSNNNMPLTPIANFWSKFDKIETESGLSTTINHKDIFSTNKPSRNHNNTPLENQPWYIRDSYYTETNNTSGTREDQKNETQQVSTQSYEQLFDNKNVSKDTLKDKQPESPRDIGRGDIELQPLNNTEPETPRDLGRGDIGPEDVTDFDSIVIIPHNTVDNPVNSDSVHQQIVQNVMPVEKEVFNDQLAVLSIQQQQQQQQHDETKLVVSLKNYTANVFEMHQQGNKDLNNNLHNVQPNKTGTIDVYNQRNKGNETEYFEVHTESNTEKNNNHQHDFPLQKNSNFEQESVNMEQENLYNFGQEDLQIFAQQNENVEQHYLQDFQRTLQEFRSHNENIEHQNLHNFGQEQVRDPGQEYKNLEQQTFEQEHQQPIGMQNKNLTQQNIHTFTQNNIQVTTEQIQNLEQQTVAQNSNVAYGLNNTQMNEQLNQNNQVTQANLPRVQKSIGSVVGTTSLSNSEQHLLHVEQKVQDLAEPSEHVRHYQHEHIYGAAYEPDLGSFDQDFEQDFIQQHQASNGNLQNFEQQSENIEDLQQVYKHNTQDYKPQIDLQNNLPNPTTTISTATTKSTSSLQTVKVPETVTEKPGFWKSVGNKFSSAKDKVVSWFKSS